MEPYFQNPIQICIFKILKQQFIYTIKLSQIDSSPDKAHNNPQTIFFLTPLHRAAYFPNIKNP